MRWAMSARRPRRCPSSSGAPRCTRFDFEKRLQALYRLVVTASPKCRARQADFVFGAFSQQVGSSRGGARLGEPVTGFCHDREVRLNRVRLRERHLRLIERESAQCALEPFKHSLYRFRDPPLLARKSLLDLPRRLATRLEFERLAAPRLRHAEIPRGDGIPGNCQQLEHTLVPPLLFAAERARLFQQLPCTRRVRIVREHRFERGHRGGCVAVRHGLLTCFDLTETPIARLEQGSQFVSAGLQVLSDATEHISLERNGLDRGSAHYQERVLTAEVRQPVRHRVINAERDARITKRRGQSLLLLELRPQGKRQATSIGLVLPREANEIRE